jgi:hypothetical protein
MMSAIIEQRLKNFIEIQPEDHSLILLNCGNEECYDIATITIGSKIKEIKLK